MVDTIDLNFEEVFTNFQHELKKCSFVAVDCEFTSLPFNELVVPSFQDSGSDRYAKIRKTINQCLPLQVGLVLFTYDRDLVEYNASIYKFNVFPKSFGPFDTGFSLKTSSIQFLRTYNFDFNKVFYNGIPFLNGAQRKHFSELACNGTLPDIVFSVLTFDEKEVIASQYELVNKWLRSNQSGNTLTIDVTAYCHSVKYVLHKEIRRSFKNAWTYHKGINSYEIMVKQVTEEERQSLETTLKSDIDEEFMASSYGFSKIIDILTTSKKPIVGHNMFVDLLSTYHYFYNPLPDNYNTFKANLVNVFPAIYDTKFISHQMKRSDFKDVLDNISLQNLYSTFQDTERQQFKPIVRNLNSSHSTSHNWAHDAGWDAYMTGFCFLKLMNILSDKRYTKCDSLANAQLMAFARPFKNRVNIPRAFNPYLVLDGPDPLSSRPPHIIVSTFQNGCLNRKNLERLLSDLGWFEVKSLTPYAASVAAPNFYSYHEAIKKLKKMDEFKVEKYSLLKHHVWFRSAFMVGLALPASFAVWYFINR